MWFFNSTSVSSIVHHGESHSTTPTRLSPPLSASPPLFLSDTLLNNTNYYIYNNSLIDVFFLKSLHVSQSECRCIHASIISSFFFMVNKSVICMSPHTTQRLIQKLITRNQTKSDSMVAKPQRSRRCKHALTYKSLHKHQYPHVHREEVCLRARARACYFSCAKSTGQRKE